MMVAPFQLEPRCEARIWGGNQICRRFARKAPTTADPIGESWEVYGELLIRHGPYQGQTLDQVTRFLGESLLGPRGGDPAEGFPLLVKWLDCRDWLSLQLHPDDTVARELTGKNDARGKSECWYFLEVEPGAEIIHGLKELPADWGTLEGRAWIDLSIRKTPLADSWTYIPAGTVHALGPGLMLYEVQQSSDLTYRLYDWDRVGLDGKPRPLHLAESRKVLESPSLSHPPPSPDPARLDGVLGKVVVTSPFFVIEEVEDRRDWQPEGSFEIVTMVEGGARLSWTGGALELKGGDSVVIPASSPSVKLETDSARAWIRVRRP